MITSRSLAAIAGLLLALTPGRPAHAVTFRGVPRRCEAQLRDVERSAGGGALIDEVDWTVFARDLERLGHSRAHARDILNTPELDADRALAVVREALQRPDWTWDAALGPGEWEKIGAELDLRDLPLWAALRGFDAAAAVRGFILARRALSSAERGLLVQMATFWMSGDGARATALAYLSRKGFAGWHPSIWWIQSRLGPEDRREFLDTYFAGLEDPAFREEKHRALLGMAPRFGQLPPAIDRGLGRWIDLTAFPPLTLKHVRIAATDVTRAGCCGHMISGHLHALFPRRLRDFGAEELTTPRLVYAGPHLIGSVKTTGEPSFLALRNVVDADGQLVFALGAVYEVAILAETSGNREQMTAMRARSRSFLINNEAWLRAHWPELRQLILDFADSELSARINIGTEDPSQFSDGAIKPEVWFAILGALDRRRLEIETSP